MSHQITVEVQINAPSETIWEYWTKPEHITQWCFASDDWHAPTATNDLQVGGQFMTRMEAKDGSEGFDFSGTYTEVEEYKQIAYVMDDGRKVQVAFIQEGEGTKVTETFDAESENPIEVQRQGWQAILNNFKNYVERQL